MPTHAPRSALAALVAVILLAGSIGGAPPVRGQEAEAAAAPPPLTIETVRVEPTAAGTEVLCRLSVTLRNRGEATASQLGFRVEVNGVELPVYRNQLFMLPVPAGASEELRLYNFWSGETGRPVPADGKLSIAVTLQEAVWMTIAMEDEVEVWTPGEAVPGLPVSASATLELGGE